MAERVLTDFIRALRSAEVRVSTSETIDATKAVAVMGYDNRTRLADTLRCVLAKSVEEKITFDRLFDLYFCRDRRSAEEGTSSEGEDDQGAASKNIMELLANPSDTNFSLAMEKASEEVGVETIRFSTQVPYFARQMMKALGVEDLESKMMDAFLDKSPEGEREAQRLIEGRQKVQRKATEYVKRAFETFGAGATERFRNEILSEKRLSQMDSHDLARMRRLVERIAKKLIAKHSRRLKRTRRGVLDVRKTLRSNAGYGGTPIDLRWKTKKKDKPRIVAICDVSGSVARVVRFFLMLIYSLKEAAPDVETFAFSGRLEDVGDTLKSQEFTPAMDQIVNSIGISSTDYGQSLSDLKTDYWNKIDRRSTVIVLGDGRSNYGDPRSDLIAEAKERSKRLIWLCPEPESLWGTGDSAILQYLPHLNKIVHVATVNDLERVIDEVLASYA